MRMKSRYVFVIAVVAVVMLYFLVRTLVGGASASTAHALPTGPAPASVQVRLTPEVLRPHDVTLRGRTQSTRTVVVRSETAGVVAQAPVMQGAVVAQGAVLCRLAVDARQASLDQARAALRSAQLQHQAAVELGKKGFRSPTQVLESQASLDSAQASVRQAEIARAQVDIRAPFTGVFDHRDAEIGTYLATGDPCGTMIELDPLLVVGDLPETEASKIKVGAAASARLVSGEVIQGRVRYISRDADPQTRTYHLEIAAANPRMDIRSGLSAEVRIGAGVGPAHLTPVSALVLDAAGRQGVRYVLADGRVAFAPVQVVEQTADGAWVSGLHGPVQLITVGQSYVSEGQKVLIGRTGG
ncbi:efflux RND transporter periplasmic adaptor subunit [Phenylobacterium sp. LjRoot225]|uniref:efflux RND transporter periplasmic adaptor subunit n=1 Tax=Phenylobacterium sp. LjRoot225 TaxID=3342285 RepID=UPI003ED0ECFC